LRENLGRLAERNINGSTLKAAGKHRRFQAIDTGHDGVQRRKKEKEGAG